MRNLLKAIEHGIKGKVAGVSKQAFQEKGFSGFGRHWLSKANIKLVAPETASRHLLNTSKGLVIANHFGPSNIDLLPILSTLERRDVSIVVSNSAFQRLRYSIGDEHLINTKSSKEFLRQARKRLSTGGLVIIFPDGDINKTGHPQFKSGFAHLLRILSPDDMVYAFRIDESDLNKVRKRIVGATTSLVLGTLGVRLPEVELQISERYTTAADWQNCMHTKAKGANSLLSAHYAGIFSDKLSTGRPEPQLSPTSALNLSPRSR